MHADTDIVVLRRTLLLTHFIHLPVGNREHLVQDTVHTASFSGCLSSRIVKLHLWLQNPSPSVLLECTVTNELAQSSV